MGKSIIVTLLEPACIIAISPSFTAPLQANLDSVIRKINTTPRDTTLGDQHASRHVECAVDEARALLTAFQNSADREALQGGDRGKIQACSDAIANIKNALFVAGCST